MPEPTTVLEEFRCFVDCISDGTAYFSIESLADGDQFYGEYPADKLAEKWIGEQNCFLVRAIKKGETTDIEIEHVPLRQVSDEEVAQIKAEIDAAFPDDGSGEILY